MPMTQAGVAMLVVTANWAYTDGTLVAAGAAPRIARAWLRRVRVAAIHAGFDRTGAYAPPDGLDLVLAGDTFDGLVSAAWTGRERPWQAGARAAAIRRQVLVGCARRAAPLLAGLARLARAGLSAPAADGRRRPSCGATARVPVRVVMLRGDRDAWLGELAADVTARGAVVAPAWVDGEVLVAHGHEHDPACHADPASPGVDRPPTLAESVAVDLVARFAGGLVAAGVPRRSWAPLVEALAAASTCEVSRVVAGWIDAHDRRAAIDAATRRGVVSVWQRAVAAWERAARRDPPDCGLPASPVESLAAWFSRPGSPPPRGLAEVLQGAPAAALAARAGATTAVLGHAVPTPHDGPTVCLGRPAVRRWGPTSIVRSDGAAEAVCVDAGDSTPEPATVACRSSGSPREWRWIMGGRGAGPEVAARCATVIDAA